MKHNKLLLLASGILAAAALTGCNQNNGGDSNIVKITFDHTFGEAIEKAVVNRFNTFKQKVLEEEGVKLELVMNPAMSYSAVVNTVGTELESGNGPTMTVAYPDHVAALQARESTPGQYIVDMDRFIDSETIGFGKEAYLGDLPQYDKDDIIDQYLKEGQQFQREGTYCLPYMKSTEIMQYNVGKVKAALAYYEPTAAMNEAQKTTFLSTMSFKQLMEIAQVVVNHKTDLNLPNLTYPVYYDSDSNMVITSLIQNGLKYSYFDDDKNPILGLDATADGNSANYTAAKALLQQFRDWHTAGLLSTKSVLGTYSSNSFKNQECVFIIGSSGGAGYSVPEAGSFDSGYARVPYFGNNSTTPDYVSQGPSIAFCNDKSVSQAVNEKRLTYAWKFYKYLILPKNNIAVACNNSMGYVPVRYSAYATNEWSKVINPDDEEDITYYTYTAKVIGDVINMHYFNTIVFNGSSKYRDYTTGAVTRLMNELETSIDTILSDAVRETKNFMSE